MISRKYIMKGRIFTSLDEISANAMSIGCDFYRCFETFRRDQRHIVAITAPSPAVQDLITAGKPVTLRDLLKATGHDNLSHADGYALGGYVCRHLPYMLRRKVEVTRSDQTMMVNLYNPNEFAEIAFLIEEWIGPNPR